MKPSGSVLIACALLAACTEAEPPAPKKVITEQAPTRTEAAPAPEVSAKPETGPDWYEHALRICADWMYADLETVPAELDGFRGATPEESKQANASARVFTGRPFNQVVRKGNTYEEYTPEIHAFPVSYDKVFIRNEDSDARLPDMVAFRKDTCTAKTVKGEGKTSIGRRHDDSLDLPDGQRKRGGSAAFFRASPDFSNSQAGAGRYDATRALPGQTTGFLQLSEAGERKGLLVYVTTPPRSEDPYSLLQVIAE